MDSQLIKVGAVPLIGGRVTGSRNLFLCACTSSARRTVATARVKMSNLLQGDGESHISEGIKPASVYDTQK